jgi:hypothetical protein
MIEFIADKLPTVSGVYYINREKQGKYYRYYNAETDQWSLSGISYDEAIEFKDRKGVVGFFPWFGPVAKKLEVKTEIEVRPSEYEPVKRKRKTKAKAEVAQPAPAKKKTKKSDTKVEYANGSVFFREDRKKWVAVWNGKQEAARDSAEKCLSFLKKKYNVDGAVL